MSESEAETSVAQEPTMPDDRRHPLDSGRDHSHGTENDNLKPRDGAPPRPATEPEGAEHSTRTNKTLTDPATGHPQGG